ncbi:hypothetical protein PF005_g13104 [Phytophthora fragariae]|uniref:Uncharacterized protein n=1 Tax=Phytophthora fragariae TaxID=53985 RepID=A0A6A3HDL9_9STRA|nr:hypothetical protein PF009_g13844 [Phytophthora fragariae]KAE8967470.1 hypothetical protein PF011_g27549 [Phytophthora fragariae]KAE9206185.1 hypothetical protein PF005_g13104 [Phytophthora fragariae]KAE9337025.1 hypothetical protein PF008_g12753 [Phytophthora fragariae]
MTGFTSRWAELTKKGWKSKRPTGLSNDHTYLRPGKTKKDVRGVDYFVGAEELMKYLDKVDLDAARQAAAASPRSGAAAGAPKAVEEVDSAAASTDATATSASARLLQRHRAPVLQFEHNLLTYVRTIHLAATRLRPMTRRLQVVRVTRIQMMWWLLAAT